MSPKPSLRVKVAGLQQQDVGKGVVRLGQTQFRDLELERGDVVEITGNVLALPLPSPPTQKMRAWLSSAWMDLSAELDGMEELRGVVLGASNRPSRIDPALLRPGRFDEIVFVPIPDDLTRLEIFRTHPSGMALGPDVDLQKFAEISERFTGADIAGICMKAGLYALRENASAQYVVMEHFFHAIKEASPSVTAEMEQEYGKQARQIKQEAVRIGFGR